MGVPQDHVWSYAWNNLAAAEGMKNAAGNRDRLASMMTMTQIAEGQALSRKIAAQIAAGVK